MTQNDDDADNGVDESMEGQAARLLAEEKPKPEPAPEADDDGESETEDDETADDADQSEDEEDDPDGEGERFSFDEKVLEGLPEDKAKAIRDRWRQQVRGIEKSHEKESTVLHTYLNAFEDPAHAGPALMELAKTVASHHGKSVNDLLGVAGPESADESVEDLGEDEDWQTVVDRKIARRVQELEERYKPLVEERESRAQREAFDARLRQIVPLVTNYGRTHWGGFKPKAEQIAEALENLPKLRDKPIKAVERWFAKDILSAQQKRQERRAPDMARPAGRMESEAVDMSEMSLEEQARRILRRQT